MKTTEEKIDGKTRQEWEAFLIPFVKHIAPQEDTTLRVPEKIARIWLLENWNHIVGGVVRYIQIKKIGLGVVEIKVRPVGKKNTFVVTLWETA